jgi:hypothetical protein
METIFELHVNHPLYEFGWVVNETIESCLIEEPERIGLSRTTGPPCGGDARNLDSIDGSKGKTAAFQMITLDSTIIVWTRDYSHLIICKIRKGNRKCLIMF